MKFGEISGEDGIFIYPDGTYKRGKFKDGRMHGFGMIEYVVNKHKYVGQWRFDLPHGKGE